MALLGVLFAQLVVGVVGVLAFSGEYGTGMIRATLAVVPARLPVLWAKVIVLAGLVLPVTMLCAFVDYFVAAAIESSRVGSAFSLTDPGVLRKVAGSSLYLTVVVIIGLALGALLRKTAAGLSVFAAVFFVVPIVVGALPQNITGFAPYLPSNAGGALWGDPLDHRACAEPVDRIRGPVRLRGRADRPGRLAAAPPRRLTTPERRRGYDRSFWTPVENPGTRPPRSRVFDIACTLLAAAASFGSFSFAQGTHPPFPTLAVSLIVAVLTAAVPAQWPVRTELFQVAPAISLYTVAVTMSRITGFVAGTLAAAAGQSGWLAAIYERSIVVRAS